MIQLRDTQRIEGKKKRAQSFLVPQGEKKTSGVKSQSAVGQRAVRHRSRTRTQRQGRSHAAPGVSPAHRSTARVAPRRRRHPRGSCGIRSRRLVGAASARGLAGDRRDQSGDDFPALSATATSSASARPSVERPPRSRLTAEEAPWSMCLIDGEPRPIERAPRFDQGRVGRAELGRQHRVVQRPGFRVLRQDERQGENAPIGQRAAFAYTTALNHLLGKDSRQRMQVGDASTVFWADRDSAFEGLFAELFGSSDDPDRGTAAVQGAFRFAEERPASVGERDVRFFVLGLAPNAARIAVRFWLHAPLAELAPRIAQHFRDLRVARRYDGDPHHAIALSLAHQLRRTGQGRQRAAAAWPANGCAAFSKACPIPPRCSTPPSCAARPSKR